MFDSNKTVVLIKPEGLQFFNKNGTSEIMFGIDVVNFQEVLDKTKLAIIINHVINENEGSQKVIFLLSDQLVYVKDINIKDPLMVRSDYDKFISEIPFPVENVGKIKNYDQTKLKVIATNNDLYQSIIEIFKRPNWEVQAVIPISAFNLTGRNMTSSQVDSVFDAASSLKKFDFLKQIPDQVKTESISNQEELEPQKLNKKYYLISLIIFLIFLIGLFLYLFKDRLFPAEIKPVNLKTVEIQNTPTPTPTIALSKSEVNIQVLNASGRSGQASQIKDELSKLGYTNITTSNNPKISNKTIVSYTSKLPDNFRQEIIAELNKSISSISAEATSSASYDLAIILGK